MVPERISRVQGKVCRRASNRSPYGVLGVGFGDQTRQVSGLAPLRCIWGCGCHVSSIVKVAHHRVDRCHQVGQLEHGVRKERKITQGTILRSPSYLLVKS